MLACCVDVEHLFDVEPTSFMPPPRVMSSVVRMRPKLAGAINIRDAEIMKTLVAQAFSQRRKTLHNALKGHIDDDGLRAVDIDPGMRAEEVSVDTWIALANHLSESKA